MRRLFLSVIVLLGAFVANAQKRIVVAQDGSGNYKTLQEAINAVPDNSKQVTEIFVKKGVYKERDVVPAAKINITLVGEDVTATVITFDNFAARPDSAGRPLGTSRSASFYIYGSGFVAKNITFQNSAGPVGQAVAVYVAGDEVCFINCRLLGYQDTLYTLGKGSRQYYKNCYIEGTTDFIFGAATALFEGCDLFCKKGGAYLTAASTLDTTKYGYVFMHCKITGDAPEGSFALGRPWRPYAKTVYLYCDMSNVISNEGWSNWHGTESDKTAYYAEYKNSGPGYKPGKRMAWSHQLTDAEAATYTKQLILNGWNPDKR